MASNQYGGQSISLTHLAPFVDVSRKKIAAEVEAEMEGLDVSAERKRCLLYTSAQQIADLFSVHVSALPLPSVRLVKHTAPADQMQELWTKKASNIALWIACLGIAGAAVAVTLRSRRKRS